MFDTIKTGYLSASRTNFKGFPSCTVKSAGVVTCPARPFILSVFPYRGFTGEHHTLVDASVFMSETGIFQVRCQKC